ncbi:MAG TPA: hypothetical protein PKD51_10060 [Saprospiraceae bacterium]|nr:hypothetical protein [Saprospiraceae bacterium]HMU05111.1 hypothetical protein [Saprospiraceae bacterium]
MSKNKQGGKRPGSGPKPKYGEPTTTVAFRCPESKVPELKEAVKIILKSYQL